MLDPGVPTATMDLDSPFSVYEHDDESRPLHPMASPPLDTISLGHLPFQMDQGFYHTHLDRKRRLEQDILPLENCLRRGVPYLTPKLEPGRENASTYHQYFSGAFGKDACYYGPVTFDFEYQQPPFGVPAADLSSISETDRSPSPQALMHYGFSDIQTVEPDGVNAGFPRICDAAGYGSVIPQDVQPIHETTYPEPENLVHHKVSRIYDPCTSLGYHHQGEILNDLEINEINDDADAHGEPEAVCDRHDIESKPTPSKMAKTKKTTRTHNQASAAAAGSSKSGIRKRAAPRKTGPNQKKNNKNKSQLAPKASSSADVRTYACSFKIYGCDSTFSSKNEWKRHLSSQHLKLSFYRCDLDGCCQSTKGPNDFNRKDLFTQHLRRMHAPWSGKPNPKPSREEKDQFERTLDEHHSRCRQEQRPPPPTSKCLVCRQTFTVWQDRMEHMSKHYEANANFIEPEDPALKAWALREGILCQKGYLNEFILTDKWERDSKAHA